MLPDWKDTVAVSREAIFLVASITLPVVKIDDDRSAFKGEKCDEIFALYILYLLEWNILAASFF